MPRPVGWLGDNKKKKEQEERKSKKKHEKEIGKPFNRWGGIFFIIKK